MISTVREKSDAKFQNSSFRGVASRILFSIYRETILTNEVSPGVSIANQQVKLALKMREVAVFVFHNSVA
jgi:hypothetical protein